jgi:hypothetical protein
VEGETLVFRRAAPGAREAGREFAGPSAAARPSDGAPGGVIARLQQALAGTVRYAPGFDPTEPTGEIWEADRP